MSQRKKKNTNTASKDLAYMLVAGGEQAVSELYEAVRSTLRPFGKLESRRANEFAGLEAELEQHKTLRDTRLLAEARDMLAGVFAKGGFVRVPRDQFPEAWAKADVAIYDDGPEREEALGTLELRHGVRLQEVLARAYQRIAKDLEFHETRIAALERRRREFLEDYEALRAIRARVTPEVEP